MNKERLNHFRTVLLDQLRERTAQVREDTAAALDPNDDGVKDSVDMSLMDHNRELAFRLGERESRMIAEIDQALLRIDEGTYGQCARCGQSIDERRLQAVPTARYDAACQAAIEAEDGEEDQPTL